MFCLKTFCSFVVHTNKTAFRARRMSSWKYFAVEKKDHVAEVILNRPEKLNVMDEHFFSEFGSIIDEVSKVLGNHHIPNYKTEDDTRCIIIWGRGKLFTAGLDLKQLSTIMSETDQDGKLKH